MLKRGKLCLLNSSAEKWLLQAAAFICEMNLSTVLCRIIQDSSCLTELSESLLSVHSVRSHSGCRSMLLSGTKQIKEEHTVWSNVEWKGKGGTAERSRGLDRRYRREDMCSFPEVIELIENPRDHSSGSSMLQQWRSLEGVETENICLKGHW